MNETLWLFAISFGASALGGILGMASGIFIVPLLTIFGNIDFQEAIGASLISVIACSCAGSGTYLRAKLTNYRLAMVLEVSTTLGALSGVALMGILSEKFLTFLFSLILFISAFQMFSNRKELAGKVPPPPQSWGTKLKLHGSYPDFTGKINSYYVHNLPLGAFLMYLAGTLSSLLGIGSGVLKIPAMDSALKLPIKVSSATSNFMIGVTAAAGAAAYFAQGKIIPSLTGPVVVGSVFGALLGAKILVRFSSNKLRVAFIFILIALGIQMVIQGLEKN